jgi:hypothetical protein
VRRVVGAAALAFSALYLVSDVVEAAQGGFSTGQLWLTLVAEAALPAFVVGLAVVQRPRLGRMGRYGAWAYAYAYVFFTATVIYALVDGTPDFDALDHDLRPWMTIHGAIILFAGLAFGAAVIGARTLPRWTALALMAGVVLVSAGQGLPDGLQVVCAGIRDLGFAGMGVALLRQTAPPISAPMPAVIAMAIAPQATTRTVAGRRGAPPR